jgi:nicotinate phosphoribosyltransferase
VEEILTIPDQGVVSMKLKELQTLKDVEKIQVDPGRPFFSATHDEILAGFTTDIYFVRTRELLEHFRMSGTEVAAEIFASRPGILGGVQEALNLIRHKNLEVCCLEEGEAFEQKEVIMTLRGAYGDFGLYETALLGILASSSGWATAAREIKEAAGSRPVYCFGARHLHPAVAPVMERAAIIGGADGCSCILGAKFLNRTPVGTVPHAVMIIVGDTLQVARAYHEIMPPAAPRVVLVDTFKDEAEETLRVARALGEDLSAIRLDTPSERGGVTPALVQEIRARLDREGFQHVKILVSGGITPEKAMALASAGADAFGVGSYISRAPAIDMTMDLKEVQGKEIAKRGRIPGLRPNPRLKKAL